MRSLNPRYLLLLVGIAGAVVTCTTTTAPLLIGDEPSLEQRRPPPPPYVPPPELATETWQMPDLGVSDPPFPYLPGEDQGISRSIGEVTSGYLVNGRPLPLPHPNLAILPRQFSRHLQYTSDAMIALLVDAAAHLAGAYPDAVVYMGNFSRRGGGDIPYSVSHTNGRDADLAFLVLDEQGEPRPAPDLLRHDAQGVFDGTLLEETPFPELILTFDVERNWRLIEGLIESDAADLQYIFVSHPLRRLLLAEANRQGASPSTLRIARQVLVQPAGALPHDDHFHLRIHCSPTDLASGCRERGRPGPTYSADESERRRILEEARRHLTHEHPFWRRQAIRRLAILENHGLHHRIAERLDDPDPRVRAAALRALGDDRPATEAIARRLRIEQDPNVFAEIIAELGRRGDASTAHLIKALTTEITLDWGPSGVLSATSLVADALARQERPEPVPHLIDALADALPATQRQIDQALRILTNHRLFDPSPQAWRHWWQEHGNLTRDQWLALGFQQAGFEVSEIAPEAVWEICRAISDVPYLNFNAQRALMRLSGRTTQSLHWHPHDASFYWRRYFEERNHGLSIPPVPPDLSTAAGYTPPDD